MVRGKRGRASCDDPQHPSCCESLELLRIKCKNLEKELKVERNKNSSLQADLTASMALLAKRDAEISRLKTLEQVVKAKGEEDREDELAMQKRFAHEILPPEVWDLIFNEVGSSEDLKRCCKVSRNWKQILEPRKVEWLMDEVFPLMVNLLPQKEILSYRLVCRRWCTAIDMYLTDGQYDEYEEKLFDRRGLVGYQFPRNVFQTDFGPWSGSEQPIAKFMQHMKSPHINPFIGRSLRVCVRHGSQLFLEFLRKFGHFLENLEIFFEFSERSSLPTTHTLQRVKYICDCLDQTKNLKRLSLFFTIYRGPRGLPGLLPNPLEFKNADEMDVNEYFNTNTVPIPASVQKIGYVVDTFYDGGAFEAALKRAKPYNICYGRKFGVGIHYDAVENWNIKRFWLRGMGKQNYRRPPLRNWSSDFKLTSKTFL